MSSCAKPEVGRYQVAGKPEAGSLVPTCEALIKLGREVAAKARKRPTVPALPSALERSGVPRKTAAEK